MSEVETLWSGYDRAPWLDNLNIRPSYLGHRSEPDAIVLMERQMNFYTGEYIIDWSGR